MRNPTKSLTLVVIQFVCLIGLALTGPLIPSNLVLLILQLVGAALGVWAIISMTGGSFNITPDPKANGRLVQHGPYRLLRHPMYAALLLLTLPLVIELSTVLRWAMWLLLLADLVVKLLYEETLLVEYYPDYRTYQKETKRLIPFIF